MRTALALLLLLGADPDPKTQLDALNGYQGVEWGASQKAVRKAFPKVHLVDGWPCVDAPVAGLPALAFFHFAQDKLTAVWVSFGDAPGRSAETVYRLLVNALEAKYGESAVAADALGNSSHAWRGTKTGLELSFKVAEARKVLLIYRSNELGALEDPLTKEQAKDL